MTAPKVKKVDTKSNFENFKLLKKEFESTKMDPKKHAQLREKLIVLYRDKKILPEEESLMEAMLRKERAFSKTKKATISDKNLHFLNALEEARIPTRATCKRDDLPPAMFMSKGAEVKFEFDSDREKVFIYSRVIVPVRHQLTRDIVDKEDRGHTVPEEKYPAERYYIHRQILPAKEFEQWFDVVEDLIEGDGEEKEDSEEMFVL